MNIQQKLGKRIQTLRKEAGLSQEQLSRKAGIDRTYISSTERGERNVSIRNIEKFAKGFNMSVKEFFQPNEFGKD